MQIKATLQKIARYLLITISLYLLLFFSLCGRIHISGYVRDENGKPLRGVTMSLRSFTNRVTFVCTDKGGFYQFPSYAERFRQSYLLDAHETGFEYFYVNLPPEAIQRVDITLKPRLQDSDTASANDWFDHCP